MNFKKIFAREFLILISILVVVGITYLILNVWNNQIENRNTSKHVRYESSADSLLISFKDLKKLATDYEKIPNIYSAPEYLVVFYSNEIAITKTERDDLNELSFDYWVDAIQDNDKYKRGIFDNYVPQWDSDKFSFSEWEKLVFEKSKIDSLKLVSEVLSVSTCLSEKQLALTEYKKTKKKLDTKKYILVIVSLLTGVTYLLRFLVIGIKWSIRTLKE